MKEKAGEGNAEEPMDESSEKNVQEAADDSMEGSKEAADEPMEESPDGNQKDSTDNPNKEVAADVEEVHEEVNQVDKDMDVETNENVGVEENQEKDASEAEDKETGESAENTAEERNEAEGNEEVEETGRSEDTKEDGESEDKAEDSSEAQDKEAEESSEAQDKEAEQSSEAQDKETEESSEAQDKETEESSEAQDKDTEESSEAQGKETEESDKTQDSKEGDESEDGSKTQDKEAEERSELQDKEAGETNEAQDKESNETQDKENEGEDSQMSDKAKEPEVIMEVDDDADKGKDDVMAAESEESKKDDTEVVEVVKRSTIRVIDPTKHQDEDDQIQVIEDDAYKGDDDDVKPGTSAGPIRRSGRQAARRATNEISRYAQQAALDDMLEDSPEGPGTTKTIRGGSEKECYQCNIVKPCKYQVLMNGNTNYLCDDSCFGSFKATRSVKSPGTANKTRTIVGLACEQCKKTVVDKLKGITWEGMIFCTEDCLEKYQKILGGRCANCSKQVQMTSLGKYCVRFGCDLKQFCSNVCLEEFKKGLKVCSYCQKDISGTKDGFLAPVGDKGLFKDFCAQGCMEKYESMHSGKGLRPQGVAACSVCKLERPVKAEVLRDGHDIALCSDPCVLAFKFANKITLVKCELCQKYLQETKFTLLHDDRLKKYCSKTCLNVFILSNRKIVPCSWCKVKKYNFDMIEKMTMSQFQQFCSLNCLTLMRVSQGATKTVRCEQCSKLAPVACHLTMSDGTHRNFCSYPCVNKYQNQFNNKADNAESSTPTTSNASTLTTNNTGKTQVVVKPATPKATKNKTVLCKSSMIGKGDTLKGPQKDVSTQTEGVQIGSSGIIPIPVPMYVPCPTIMWNATYAQPFPIPLPVPIPIFIPTNRKTTEGVKKEIKKILEKIPADPYEAELLAMAEAVANDGAKNSSDSEDDDKPLHSPAGDDGPVENGIIRGKRKYDNLDLDYSADDQDERLRKSKKPMDGANKKRKLNSTDTPDSDCVVKYTFGVNAFRQWVTKKNEEKRKEGIVKKLKGDPLQQTPDELSFALSLFIKEVKRPDETEYSADALYYLCLGIQQFLYENGRIDNIFSDPFYEIFAKTFDELADGFSDQYDQFGSVGCITTRIQEEALWECQQLGAHSPFVLLNTLMFFNTKYFLLQTAEHHMTLSFSHVLTHWRKGPKGNTKSALLRFYPPASLKAKQGQNKENKKPLEQYESPDNPLRCPVKLYEFYLSKCPETMKTRNDVFYLMPERSCVPESPVWYSNQPVSKDVVARMLKRILMVKEVGEKILDEDNNTLE